MRKSISVLFALTGVLFAGTASAYVGPGAGISVLGALWGLIIGVVMAVGVILFWPIRMMMRKKKAEKEAKQAASNNDSADSDQQDANTSQDS